MQKTLDAKKTLDTNKQWTEKKDPTGCKKVCVRELMKSSVFFFCYEISNLWDISLVSAKFVNFESLCLENLSISYDRAAQSLFDEVISKCLEFLVG